MQNEALLEDASTSLLRVVQEDEGAGDEVSPVSCFIGWSLTHGPTRSAPPLASLEGVSSKGLTRPHATPQTPLKPRVTVTSPPPPRRHSTAQLVERGSMEILITHLENPNEELQVRICGLIYGCCEQVPSVRKELHKLGAVKKILPLLSSSAEEVQEAGAVSAARLEPSALQPTASPPTSTPPHHLTTSPPHHLTTSPPHHLLPHHPAPDAPPLTRPFTFTARHREDLAHASRCGRRAP